jgi:acyl dehydratase
MGVNYGLNKVRFIAPVHVGSSVRTRVTLKEVTDVPGGIQVVIEGTFEVKEKVRVPVCACATSS